MFCLPIIMSRITLDFSQIPLCTLFIFTQTWRFQQFGMPVLQISFNQFWYAYHFYIIRTECPIPPMRIGTYVEVRNSYIFLKTSLTFTLGIIIFSWHKLLGFDLTAASGRLVFGANCTSIPSWWKVYVVLPAALPHSRFSLKSRQKAIHSSPFRARCGVSFLG